MTSGRGVLPQQAIKTEKACFINCVVLLQELLLIVFECAAAAAAVPRTPPLVAAFPR